jgi:hypothetical protein
MATADAIKAGAAYVQLSLDSGRLTSGLATVKASLNKWATGVAAIGAGVTALGAAVKGSLGAAMYSFIEKGDELEKLSIRTGMSVEQLSLLSYTAGQSDASLEDVGKSAKHLAKFLLEANAGSKEATDALQALGLKFEDLRRLSPDELFERFGRALADLPLNTFERNAIAIKAFGREGLKLIPMFKDFEHLKKEAGELGLGQVSAKDAHAAVELGDAFKRLKAILGSGIFAVGAAIAPDFKAILDIIQPLLAGSIRWVKANRDIAQTVSFIATGLIVVGSILSAIGMALIFLTTGASAFAAVCGFILSPWTLILAAVTALLYQTGLLNKAFTGLKGGLAGFLEGMKPEWDAIINAIKHGDLELAFQIAMTAVQVIWREGIGKMLKEWAAAVQQIKSDFLDGLAVIEIKWLEFQRGLLKIGIGQGTASDFLDSSIIVRLIQGKTINPLKYEGQTTANATDEELAARQREIAAQRKAGWAEAARPKTKWVEDKSIHSSGRPNWPGGGYWKEINEEEELNDLKKRLKGLVDQSNALPPLPERARRVAEEVPDFTDQSKLGALGTFSGKSAQALFGGDTAERTARATERSADYLAKIAAAVNTGGLVFG